MTILRFLPLAGLPLLISSPLRAGSLSALSNYSAVSAEIISLDPGTGFLLATAETGVEIVNISDPAAPVQQALINFEGVFASPQSVANVSSVAADPLGRGFAAAALIGSDDTGAPGKVVVFNTSTGAVMNSFDVGFHPDCVAFSDDGAYVMVANEGEWNTTANTPGSVSVISIGADTALDAVALLSASASATYDFSAGNLAEGVSLEGLRVSDPAEGLPNGLEPEYVSYADGRVYCSIQESSAIGVLDIASGKWVDIIRMPYVMQRIDASDKDGGAHIDDTVIYGMPMPDTIKAFMHEGTTYVVTANEGDFNPNDTDKARIKDLGKDGLPAIDAAYLAELNALYDGDALADDALGRLNISIIDGLNANGEFEQFYVPGTRSFSVIDCSTGQVVWDSGSALEELTAELDPAGYQDGRSDDKGPEPEGLCVFEMHKERFLALVTERTYALFLYNISDPLHPVFADYFRASDTDEEPESVLFLSPDVEHGISPKLIVSYEASKTVNILGMNTWAGFPRDPAEQYVNTYGWMGWMYVDGNWAYNWNIDTWFYMPSSFFQNDGSWAYMLD
ncbi:MAG: choice-of-anchor I family protein [Opitutales bacterium]|jgi:hypothetical protein